MDQAGEMRVYGLIGYPLGHSLSRNYFEKKFRDEGIRNASYRLFELETLAQFHDLLKSSRDVYGLNVTIPYKQQIIPLLDNIDHEAGSIGSVNCIRVDRTGGGYATTGFNTDAEGFRKSLIPLLKPGHERALILGTGGSSRTVAYVLTKLGISCTFVSRTPGTGAQIIYEQVNADLLSEHLLVINTTPLGMFPGVNKYPPLPYQALGNKHLLYDLVYNPAESRFLQFGRKADSLTKNGMEMLTLQAEYSWAIWTGHQPA